MTEENYEMAQNITIPPASNQTLLPSNAEFQLTANQACTVCFSAASTPGTFPGIAGQTFQCGPGQVLGPYPIPSTTGAHVYFNTSAPNSVCNPNSLGDTGHVIVVGSGMNPKRSKKKAKKAPAKKKVVARKGGSKPAAKPKPAKKAAKKATKKAPKKSAKKAAKKKPAKKAAKKSRR